MTLSLRRSRTSLTSQETNQNGILDTRKSRVSNGHSNGASQILHKKDSDVSEDKKENFEVPTSEIKMFYFGERQENAGLNSSPTSMVNSLRKKFLNEMSAANAPSNQSAVSPAPALPPPCTKPLLQKTVRLLLLRSLKITKLPD